MGRSVAMEQIDKKRRKKYDVRVKRQRRFSVGDRVQVGKKAGDGSYPGEVTGVVSGGYYVAVKIGGRQRQPEFYAYDHVHPVEKKAKGNKQKAKEQQQSKQGRK